MISNRRKKKEVRRIHATPTDAGKPPISSAEQTRSGSKSSARSGLRTVRALLAKRELRIYRIVSLPEET
jgi:hypothetical protein